MSLGRALAAALHRLVMRIHSPVETGVDDPRVVCTSHRRPFEWPCREYVEAVDRLDEVTSA